MFFDARKASQAVLAAQADISTTLTTINMLSAFIQREEEEEEAV